MPDPDAPNVLSPRSLNLCDREQVQESCTTTRGISVHPQQIHIRQDTLTKAGILTLAGIALAPLVTLLLPQSPSSQYVGTFQLAIEPLSNPTAKPNSLGTPVGAIDYETQVRVLWSPKVVTPIVHRLQIQYPDLTTATLLQHLSITHQPGSNRLSITYRDQNRIQTQAIVQQLAHSYLQLSQEGHGGVHQALQFIDQRLPQLQQQLTVAQHRLTALNQAVGMTDPQSYGQHLTQRMQSLLQQRQQLQVQMADAQARSQILQQPLELADLQFAENLLQQSPQYQQQLLQLRQTTAQFYLRLDDPRHDPASVQRLQQQYQQRLIELTQAAQAIALKNLPVLRSQHQIKQNSSELQLLKEWLAVTQQIQMIHLQQQLLSESEQRLRKLVQQWAIFAREHAALQLQLQTLNSQLNIYHQRKAELIPQSNAQIVTQLVAPPEIMPVPHATDGHGETLRLPIVVASSLSLLLLILVWVALQQTSPAQTTPPSTQAQTATTLLNQPPPHQVSLLYYRWLFKAIATVPIPFQKQSLPMSSSQPTDSNLS